MSNVDNFFVFTNLAVVGKPFQGLRSGGGMKHELTPEVGERSD